jgi:hypothetical protein
MPVKKIKSIFNRVASHGATAAVALMLSIGTGIGTNSALDSTHENTAPIASVQAHSVAEAKVKYMAVDILREQAKLDFTATSIAKAQANLGTSTEPLPAQMQQLNDIREQYDRDMESQAKRLADFRREIWFNPALSEKQADVLYQDLFYAAQGKNLSTINNFLAPMTDALAFRDETIAAMKLAHDPLQADNATTAQVVEKARAADDSHDAWEIMGGIGAALAEGFMAVGLIAAGFRGRKREEEEAEREQEQRERDRRIADAARRETQRQAERAAATPVQDNKPLIDEDTAPARKIATGPGKFSV